MRPLVHGSTYFAALADALAQVGRGDLVLFSDWRGDPDQRLTDGGATVTEALSAAVLRGALVKGLMWRSHLDRLRFSNRRTAASPSGSTTRAARCSSTSASARRQPPPEVRGHPPPGRPADDVALLGGIDLAHGRRDDAGHRGDPQAVPFAHQYGPRPAWHDVHVEIRGPAVRDVEDVFRERWEDPAALSRLPWQAVPDVLHREDREPGPLPPPAPDPPAGRHLRGPAPAHLPAASSRVPVRAATASAAPPAAYAKALRRARRLVYIEDQYLWSADVARVFAAALRREPGLHLVAVVPRHPDQDDRLACRPCGSATREACRSCAPREATA